MPNTIITPSIIGKESLVNLENSLVFGKMVHRQYANEFKKVGDTISIRKPVQGLVGDGADITNSIQDITEGTVSLTIGYRKHAAWAFNTKDLTLSVEEYSERYIQPHTRQLAQEVDFALSGLYAEVFNAVGTAAQTPNTFLSLGNAMKKLQKFGVPEPINVVYNPDAAWSMMDCLKGIFDPKTAKDIVVNGSLGRTAGMDLALSQNVRSHTKGTMTGTPVIDTVSGVTYITSSVQANTSILHTDGWTGTVVAGDIITVADVYAVNPRSKQSTGDLQQFTVVENLTHDTDSPIVVSPAIVASGAYQNVNAAPVDGKAVTIVGSHVSNLAFHKNAFALVTVPIQIPDGVSFSGRQTANGLSIRVIKDYDILKDIEIIRLDIMFGIKCINPYWATRILG